MEVLQSHVPTDADGKMLLQMAAFGDGLSVERMVHEQWHRLDCDTEAGHSTGVPPSGKRCRLDGVCLWDRGREREGGEQFVDICHLAVRYLIMIEYSIIYRKHGSHKL